MGVVRHSSGGAEHHVGGGPARQPLQALESAVLGDVLAFASGAVERRKKAGVIGTLGVPSAVYRFAQTVVPMYRELFFHPGSYGCRPGRSALKAVGQCRKRCRKFDSVINSVSSRRP